MKKFTLRGLVSFLFMVIGLVAVAQQQFPTLKVPFAPSQKGATAPKAVHRCTTMEEMQKMIAADPSLLDKWKAEGEKQYAAYLARVQSGREQNTERTEANPIIVPIVFHLVDNAANLASISDRDVYEQVEMLNRDYAGTKLDAYTDVIPPLAAARVGRVPIKFVLAKRTPAGVLTNGIERRVNASPDHVSIKATASGGLDAWDVTKYVNVWCGTFSGADNGLLGIATFPFTTGQGAQGVVIGLTTLPYTSNLARSYYPNYSEGSTLAHELGHYFYLFHTFGDQNSCNQNDFQLQTGWPLPTGAGPEGDDTPSEKGDANQSFIFGNPSQNYSDGCAVETFGIMYGSYMNYFDDRALFMFSDGMRKRVEGCINLYRAGLLTTDGATAPSPVLDAYMVNVSTRGYLERPAFVVANTPLQATVRNRGDATLTSVTVNVSIDGGAPTTTVFPVSLAPEAEATLTLANMSASAGNHVYKLYTSAPNGGTDGFPTNDTLYSYVNIHAGTGSLAFNEDFSGATFPPTGWQIWNPNLGATNTWTKNATAGFTAAGAAYFNDFNVNQAGTLDELITPALDLGGATASTLTFKVAYAAYDAIDVSAWDGLEVYVSGDGGKNYRLAYKKSGTALGTVAPTTSNFTATPATPGNWRSETVSLTPYIVAGQKMIIKFRNLNAFGNNLYIDDIGISSPSSGLDAQISAIVTPANASTVSCNPTKPVVTIKNPGTVTLTSATINVKLNGTLIGSQAWTGSLASGATANVTLTSVPITSVTGSNTLKVYTSAPNGGVDVAPANDTATSVYTKNNGSALPLAEGFEGTTFVPAGWTLNNPDGGITWARNTTAPAATGTATAWMNFYSYSATGQFDELITPVVDLSATGNKLISFARAYRAYGNPPASTDRDTLEVLLSFDCGTSYTSVYKAWGQGNPIGADNNLGSVPTTGTGQYTPAGPADYATKEIDFTALAGASQSVIAKFKATTKFGNNLFLDNVNIRRQFDRDLTIQSVTRPGVAECGPFTPVIIVRNAGAAIVTSYNINYAIDGGTTVTFAVNTPIAIGATATLTLPSITVAAGTHTFNAFTSAPVSASGTGDQNTGNDALTKSFISRTLVSPPVVEGFEAISFPSPGWSIVNPTGVTWTRSTPGNNSDHNAFIDNYLGTATGEIDDIMSPAVQAAGADSIIISFDLAHKYFTGNNDSLFVMTSGDCGNAFDNVPFIGGDPSLATAGEDDNAYTTPAPGDWKTKRLAVGATKFPNGNIMMIVRNKSGFGNGMFVDNINIETLYKRDIQVLSIARPNGVECTGSFSAQALIKNKGSETVTGFTVSYSLDGGPAQLTTVTGASIVRDATQLVTLVPALSGLTGSHIIKVYSANPVTASGTGDQLTTNDTLSKAFGIAGNIAAPLTEGFESTTFPPVGWVASNPDAGITWSKGTVGHNSASSAFMHNFTYTSKGRIDDLFSPNVTYSNVDSVTLAFDVAAATGQFPGTNGLALDTLEVLITKDCGNTFSSIYKKWGNELQTVNDPNFPQTTEFTPSNSQWRTETIDLTNSTFVPNGPVQLVFRNTTANGNNIYLDNVNLTTRVLPQALKLRGVLVLPNPFATTFSIWSLQPPTDLRSVGVINSAGQLVYKAEYDGNATKIIPIDLSRQPAGTYIVDLNYNDRKKNTQVKVVKL